MRIAWYTPLSPANPVSHFSAAVVLELAKLAEVYVIAGDVMPTDNYLKIDVPMRFPLDSSAPDIKRIYEGFDLNIYNLGSGLSGYRHIYEISRKQPGLMILHDSTMFKFLWELAQEQSDKFDAFHYELIFSHGEVGEQFVNELRQRSLQESNYLIAEQKFNMLRSVVRGQYGVVTHLEATGELLKPLVMFSKVIPYKLLKGQAQQWLVTRYCQVLLTFAANLLYNLPILNLTDELSTYLLEWDDPEARVNMSEFLAMEITHFILQNAAH
jgi:hypothetical protein